jgi:uncharacterized protein
MLEVVKEGEVEKEVEYPVVFILYQTPLSDLVNKDLKSAMDSGEKLRHETLRSLYDSMLELKKSGKVVSATDEVNVVKNHVNRRREAAEQYRNAGRSDLAEKEEAELKIIESYLPEQMIENHQSRGDEAG